MALPRVIDVVPGSPAATAGVHIGDVVHSINGEAPRDIIRYQLLVDEPALDIEVDRGGISLGFEINKSAGERLGIEVQSALFDQVRTCDNHCSFCFIYQLPDGMRPSLSLKDDDFRLSFLYGNFTTLTRFTEADLERVVTEGLSPLYVSIHATDHSLRNQMLRNRRGGPSLRWLRALLDHGIEIHGQVVVCPGLNDGNHLEQTMAGVLAEYPELSSLAVVPLGISAHSNEPEMRSHTRAEAERVIEIVEEWQEIFVDLFQRRMVFAADEYYLLAQRPFPASETYEGFPMHEDGIGMARTFEREFGGLHEVAAGPKAGFFASVDGAPAAGYRAPRLGQTATTAPGVVTLRPRADAPIGVITSSYGARVLGPLLTGQQRSDVRLVTVDNQFFGGNIAVTGLLVGADIARVLASEPAGHRYLLPDVCLSQGLFLDGMTIEELPHPVEIVATDGIALRQALQPRGVNAA